MDAKNTTSLAIAAGLIAAFFLGGLTFAVAVPLTRLAAGAVFGGPASFHADARGPMGHDLDGWHGRGMGSEGKGYRMPGERGGRGMMPGQRGEWGGTPGWCDQLPEDHPRLDEDREWQRGPGMRGFEPDEDAPAPDTDPEDANWSGACPECPVSTF
jgi:hypothetical protein